MNWTSRLYLGFSGAMGGILAALSDILQKDQASAVMKIHDSLRTTLGVPSHPLLVVGMLVGFAVALCFIFDARTNRRAFYIGASIPSILMTIVPYRVAPSLGSNRSQAMNSVAAPAGLGSVLLTPWKVFAQSAQENKSEIGVEVHLHTADNRPVDQAVYTLIKRGSEEIVGRSAIKGADFSFYVVPDTYRLRIEVAGYRIVELELPARAAAPDTQNMAPWGPWSIPLVPTSIPVQIQRVFDTRKTSGMLVAVYDGTRNPLPSNISFLLRVIDGNQKELLADFISGSVHQVRVPFYDGLGDNYTIIASADNYSQAGFTPVKVKPESVSSVNLMLLPKNGKFDFQAAAWEQIRRTDPKLWMLLKGGVTEAVAKKRYEDLMKTKPATLAGLLNLTTAMSTIALPTGDALSYLKELLWNDTVAQDRLFAYADQAVVDQLKSASTNGQFARVPVPSSFFPGATSGYKEIQFGEANVQLMFYGNDKRVIDGHDCLKVEVFMDYFKHLAAHALVEIAPSNTGLVDPKIVYVLRWMAGRRAGVPEFEPPYTIH